MNDNMHDAFREDLDAILKKHGATMEIRAEFEEGWAYGEVIISFGEYKGVSNELVLDSGDYNG